MSIIATAADSADQASLSASIRKKGDRVIVKANPNEWYTGTITRINPTSTSVLFDDHATSVIKEPDYKDMKPMLINYKSDEPLTDAEALPLWKKAASTVSKIKMPVKEVPSKDTDKVAMAARDKQLLKHGHAKAYEQARGSNNPALIVKWMHLAWTSLNHAYFKGAMREPVLVNITYAQERKAKVGGVWKAMDRHLCLGVTLFDGTELSVLKALLHEMCHQAVSEIDNLVGVGHGVPWGRWMHTVGQHVYLQIDPTHDVPYMLQFEPADAAQLPLMRLTPRETAVKGLMPIVRMPRRDTPVQVYTKGGTIRKGLLVANPDKDATTCILILVPSSDRYQTVDIADVYVLPDEEHLEYRSQMWRSSAARIAVTMGFVS